MSFQPNPNDELTIGGEVYRVAEHPAAPGIAHGQEGRAGIVYHLLPVGQVANLSYALKVFKPRFRLPFLVSQAEKLALYADLPGLTACRRVVLTPSRHASLLRQHPDLAYAVLMPWIEGPNWQEFLLNEQPLTVEQSLLLARSLAEVLLAMEERGLAHCDLSGPNVMLPALANPPAPFGRGAGGEGVELVDLEGFYAPGMIQPQALSSGSAGYAHRQAAGGLWGPEADRFAGAVLLAEMLGWCDPAVVAQAWGESYFEPGEMQADCERYRLLEGSLVRNWGDGVAHLFRRAWKSDALADCPTFGEWLVALPERAPAPAPTESPAVAAQPAIPLPEGEGPGVRAEPAPLVAEVRAFLQAARRMEERSNLDGALELYRQALELAQGDPALGSMAREVELTLQEVESKRRAVQPPPAPVGPVAAVPISAEAAPPLPEGEGPGVRAEPRPRRRWGWVWAVMLLLLAAAGGDLWAWNAQQQEIARQAALSTAVARDATATAQARATATAQARATATARALKSNRIVFHSDRDGQGEIYVMNADGSGQTNLTKSSDWEWWPVWSPDG